MDCSGTGQPSPSAKADWFGQIHATILGIDLLSGLINSFIAAALATLLLTHIWIAPLQNVLALAALIILTAAALSFLSAGRLRPESRRPAGR